MSQIRNLTLLYESEDIVLFTNHPTLRAILVKLLQTARIIMNKKRLRIGNDDHWRPTPQESWMINILYKDVDYRRTQKYWKKK